MRLISLLALSLAIVMPAQAMAWGSEGHEIIADIARDYLTPQVRVKVDALLATDIDTLTAPDMASRATWADAWRGAGHRETASWHFVDTELDKPDLQAACFGYPAAATPASAGPAQDCVVDKIEEFQAELSSARTAPPERVLTLVYLLHFVGDLHQPLHASDNHDRGGNCVHVSLGGARTTNLHSYWDTTVVQALGSDPQAVAKALEAKITPAQRDAWQEGDVKAWALETYGVAKSAAYTLGSPAGCGTDQAPIQIPSAYNDRAETVAAVQLEKAGVRLAWVLNRALR